VLLGPDPDVETTRPAWLSIARVVMADDGGSVIVQLGLSERGLPDGAITCCAITRSSPREARRPSPELKRGRDYDCRGGWFYSLHYRRRKRHTVAAAFAAGGKDGSGALIAGATIRDQSVGWAMRRACRYGQPTTRAGTAGRNASAPRMIG
jgi:hypothetical protein